MFKKVRKRLNYRWLVQIYDFRLLVCEASVTIIVKLIAVIGHVFYISDAKKGAGKRGGGAWTIGVPRGRGSHPGTEDIPTGHSR